MKLEVSFFRVLLPASILAASLFSASALDWYRWRGPDLNGISKEKNWQSEWPEEGPKQLWKANVGQGFSSLAVSKGRVYTTGNSNDVDTVSCLDANTGREIWKRSYDCPLDPKFYEGGTSATPTVDGDHVYAISKRGDLFCLDAAKGKVLWSKSLTNELHVEIPTWGFAGSPLVEGNLLILNVGSAGTALDKKTGRLIWSNGTNVSGYSTPVPFNDGKARAILLCLKEDIGAFRMKDGKELWRYPWKTRYDVNAAQPILSDDKVFVSSGYDHGAMVLKVTDNKPELVWENKNIRNHINSSVLWNGFVYGPNETELACVDFATGEKKWAEKSFGKGSLMMADAKIIALSDKGELMIVEPTPEKFKAISRSQVIGGKCWSTPVLSNGKIYCRNAKGDIVCVDVSGKQTASSK